MNTKRYSKIRYKDQSVFENYARQKGLQSKSLSILMWIYYNPEGVTQNYIGRQTYSTKQVVNATIKSFAAKGLVIFKDSTVDKREKLVYLTEAGNEYAKAILDPLEQYEDQAMRTLSVEEQKQLLELAQKFNASLVTLLQKGGQ